MRSSSRCASAALTALLLAVAGAAAQSRAAESGTEVDWTTYAGDWSASKYKPLDQINASNFNQLEVVWRFKTDHIGNRPEFKLEGTPLEIGGVIYTTAGSRRGVHAAEVDPVPVPESLVPAQRVSQRRIVADPVGVSPPQRREPGVEAGRRGLDRPDPDLRRQQPGQPPGRGARGRGPARGGDIHVRHLTPRVHAGVSPPGHGQQWRPGERQRPPQRLLDGLLDGGQAGLGSPAVEG